jgi:methylase of polypeptide subunit release factors
VLGVGGASLSLVTLTVRDRVRRALDLGTGCGVQSLHLAEHADRVVATDRSDRALAMAALTLALSDVETVELRAGDLFSPVARDRFDLIVSNPPFVIGGSGRYTYRDSGLPGDEVCRRLVRAAPAHLTDGGWCQLLANWVHERGTDWRGRVADWVRGTGCDAWIVQREVQDPAEYVEMWLRDTGESAAPDSAERYRAWLELLDAQHVEAIGFGWITLRAGAGDAADVRVEELRQPLDPALGTAVREQFAALDWLRARATDADLLAERFVAPADVRLEQSAAATADGWAVERQALVRLSGLHRRAAIDAVGADVVGACDGTRRLAEVLTAVAAEYALDLGDVLPAALPAVRGLVADGLLRPLTIAAEGTVEGTAE